MLTECLQKSKKEIQGYANCSVLHLIIIPHSRKLLREKTYANFEVLWLLAKVFSAKLGDVVSFGGDISEQSVKVFSAKILFPPNRESFFP